MLQQVYKLVALTLLFASPPVVAKNTLAVEFDPYYSNIGYFISLTDKPIPEVTTDDETAIYDRMWQSAIGAPRFFLIEASINPLPILGTAIRRNYPEKYDSADIGSDLNLVQAVTEGFDEPWAISFFLGSVVQFVQPGEKTRTSNKGYSGLLLSVGSRHIVNNIQVDDEWYEFEWKIKGDREFNNKTLSWSFRVGAKIHQNVDIADVIYVGIRRNHLDSLSDDVAWFDNSDIDFKLGFSREDGSVVSSSVFINKKWLLPFTAKTVFEFGVGFILENDKYTGGLSAQDDDFSLILRPSFSF